MYANHAHLTNNSHKINNGDGCQATILGKDGKCGEMRSLGILKEFQQLYEDKLSKIDGTCNCMSSQIKVQMLQDWVKDLTEQNTLLVQVVEELEHEASERVALLEDRLRHSSSTSYEIMQTLQEYDSQNLTEQSDILRQLMYYQSDISNLTEFIRRIREDGLWSIEGLHFYCVSHDDLCNDVPVKARCQKDVEDSYIRLQLELVKAKKVQEDLEREAQTKELVIQEQTAQIEKLNNVVERCATSMPDRQRLLEELHELRAQVKYKTEEYVKLEQSEDEIQKPDEFQNTFDSLEQENDSLRKTMKDAQEEIIVLHNLVQKYNREQNETINLLKSKLNNDALVLQSQDVDSSTERLSESDSDPDFTKSLFVLKQNINKMFALKDNEEIMQLRKQLIEVDTAMQEIENRDKLIQNKDEMIKIQSDTLNVAQRELKELREKIFDIEDERDNRLQEVRNLQQALKLHQSTIEELEKALTNSEEKASNIQQTVDLNVNTIQILEESKVKSEMEIEQQRITIGNLQSALVSSKHQLDEAQGRGASDVSWMERWTGLKPSRRSVHDV